MDTVKKLFFRIGFPAILIFASFAAPFFYGGSAGAAPTPVEQGCQKKVVERFFTDYKTQGHIEIAGPDDNGVYTCGFYSNPIIQGGEQKLKASWSLDETGETVAVNGITSENFFAGDQAKFTEDGKKNKAPMNCSIFAPGKFFDECIWFPLMSWLGSWFLTVNGFLVWIAGGLFDVLVHRVIIAFGQTLSDLHIIESIGNGWRIFRDVGNIVIIGMFVFISIGIILGLKTYGDKKLIANLLIIAVLINFSLLFTKMIVDFSNFTALQFYKASAQTFVADPTGAKTFDIASAFLAPMGITSIWNTQCLTKAAGGQPCTGAGGPAAAGAAAAETSGWRAFTYGMVGGLMLAGVWVVLFYGSFQIAARAITIIFLMLTASIAFASYLIPKLSDGDYGWKAWWGALINAAIFAPLLMIFLFISLQILNTAQKALNFSSNKGLSTFITNPTGADAWQAIFIYLIVVGLLFASIKISSKISSSIGSGLLSGALNVAGAVATGGLGLMSRFAIAPALRNTVGARFYGRSEDMGTQAKEAAIRRAQLLPQIEDLKKANRFNEARDLERDLHRQERLAVRRGRQAKFAGSVADSRMNLMDTKPAKNLAKRFGLKGVLAGESTKSTESYAKAAKEAGAAGAKLAESIKPDLEKVRELAQSQKIGANKVTYDQTKAAAEAARLQADAEKQSRDAAQQQQLKMQKERDDKLIEVAQRNGVGNAADHTTAQNQTVANELRTTFEKELAHVDASMQGELRNLVQSTNMHSQDELKNLQKQIVGAIRDDGVRGIADARMQQAQHDRASTLRQEGDNINKARARIVQASIANPAVATDSDVMKVQERLAQATATFNDANKRFTDANTMADGLAQKAKELENLGRGVQEAGNAAVKAVNATMPELAAEATIQQRSRWKKMLRVETTFDKRAADRAKGSFKSRESNRSLRAALEEQLREQRAEEAANATPPAGGGTTT